MNVNVNSLFSVKFLSLISVGPQGSRLSERSQGVTLSIKLMRFYIMIANFAPWAMSLRLGPDS